MVWDIEYSFVGLTSLISKKNQSRQWSFYVLIIWAGAVLVSIVCLVPETYHPVCVCVLFYYRERITGY